MLISAILVIRRWQRYFVFSSVIIGFYCFPFFSEGCLLVCLHSKICCPAVCNLCDVCGLQRPQRNQAPLKPIISSGFMTQGQVRSK